MRLYQAPVMRLAASLLATGLSACHADPNEEAVACVQPYALPDASRLSRYNGRGTDITDLVLTARITDVQGACSGQLGARAEKAHAHVVMVVTRGPASTSAEADVPYKVVVVRAGEPIDAKEFTQHVVFPPNVTTLQVTGEEVPMLLPLGKTITGPSYHLYFMLKLSPAELVANRRNPAP